MCNQGWDSSGTDLTEQRSQLQRTLDILDCCSWQTDLERDETTWTRTVCDAFDIPPDEAPVGHEEYADFIDPRDRDAVVRQRGAIFDGEPFDIEYRIVVDGTTKWVREQADVETNSEGEPAIATGVIQNITDHKEREQDLELFRTLVDQSSDGFFVIDPQTGGILDINETACQLLGYDREELLSLSVPEINTEFTTEMWDGLVETVREQGSKAIESEHRRKDGSTFPVEIQISYASLERDYHVATVRDITERKKREQQLETARKRYQTLIEAAPEPIFVADAESGEIVEANDAAAELRRQPREEIIGLHQTDLHPGDAQRYRERFEQGTHHGETNRRFDDGSQVYFATDDGDRIPVAISAAPVSVGDRTLVHGIFRDVSEQRRYESSLEGVNTAARDFLHAETDAEIVSIAVDVATDILDVSGTAAYLYDEEAGELIPTAHSDRFDTIFETHPRFSPGDSIAWRVFTEQESAHYDDVRTAEDVYNAGTPIRSELIVPLGDHGVFIVADTTVNAFDDLTVEVAETLAATTEAALDRAEHSQELREQQRASQMQAQRLDRVRQLNDRIRTIMQVLVEARSRKQIKQQVCEELGALDQFDAVWIGDPDLSRDEIDVSAQANVPRQYLQTVPLELTGESEYPAVRAVRNRTTVSESNIAASPNREEWRSTALLHEYRSVVSVPLRYNEMLYGVLTIYSTQSDGFDELTTSVLTELGELLGFALNTVDQRHALLEDQTNMVTFELAGRDDAFVTLANRLSVDLRIDSIIPRPEGTHLVHFAVEGAETEQVQSVVDDLDEFENLRYAGEDETARYEVLLIGGCIATTITDVGAKLHSIAVSDGRCRLTVSIPAERSKQSCVRILKEHYPEIEPVAQREQSPSASRSCTGLLTDSLTDRQQEILTAAYYSGFFDQPRRQTGGEIADSLGISQPAFSKQLRAAQLNLLQSIFDE